MRLPDELVMSQSTPASLKPARGRDSQMTHFRIAHKVARDRPDNQSRSTLGENLPRSGHLPWRGAGLVARPVDHRTVSALLAVVPLTRSTRLVWPARIPVSFPVSGLYAATALLGAPPAAPMWRVCEGTHRAPMG